MPNSLEEKLRQIQITKQHYKKKIIALTEYEKEILEQLEQE